MPFWGPRLSAGGGVGYLSKSATVQYAGASVVFYFGLHIFIFGSNEDIFSTQYAVRSTQYAVRRTEARAHPSHGIRAYTAATNEDIFTKYSGTQYCYSWFFSRFAVL